VTDGFQQKLKVLRLLCQDITRMRQGEHSAAKLQIQEGWLEAEREQTKEEVVAKFEEWAKNPDVHDWLVKTWVNPQERERRKREMLGLPPLPKKRKPKKSKKKSPSGQKSKSKGRRKPGRSGRGQPVRKEAAVGVSPAESRQARPRRKKAKDQTSGANKPTRPSPSEPVPPEVVGDSSGAQTSQPAVSRASQPAGRRTGGRARRTSSKAKGCTGSEPVPPADPEAPAPVSPAESRVEPDPAPAPGPESEPVEMLMQDMPKPCEGGCVAFHPAGYCRKCCWTPEEINLWGDQPLLVQMRMVLYDIAERFRQRGGS